jgi:hypothetical protein
LLRDRQVVTLVDVPNRALLGHPLQRNRRMDMDFGMDVGRRSLNTFQDASLEI